MKSWLNTTLKRIFFEDFDRLKLSIGQLHSRGLATNEAVNLVDTEFRVFSQWGEDGIIQALIRRVPIINKTFIEFGVEDYSESNTRFLMMNNNWAGLVIDGDSRNINKIRNSYYSWRYQLRAEAEFITKGNINDIIRRSGFSEDVGLLSVDVDGNDYWIWEAIDCIRPQIVICEYNSLFGPIQKLTTPYSDSFRRRQYHHSCLIYGASIAALGGLANQKGYVCVGGNSAGNNVFFVRQDSLGSLRPVSPSAVYQKSKFREERSLSGELVGSDFSARFESVKDVEVWDIETRRMVKLKDACHA